MEMDLLVEESLILNRMQSGKCLELGVGQCGEVYCNLA